VTRVEDRREATTRRQRLDEERVSAKWLSDGLGIELSVYVCSGNAGVTHTVVVSSLLDNCACCLKRSAERNVKCGVWNVDRGMRGAGCGWWNVDRGLWGVDRAAPRSHSLSSSIKIPAC
jgi:hypothetical protein